MVYLGLLISFKQTSRTVQSAPEQNQDFWNSAIKKGWWGLKI